jgi:dipeptidyl-peptidase-3
MPRVRNINREQVLSHGRAAAGKLLVELQVRESTADGEGAREYYTKLTQPKRCLESEIGDLVLKKKLVRSRARVLLILMAFPPVASENIRSNGHIHRWRSSGAQGIPAGVIESFIERQLYIEGTTH